MSADPTPKPSSVVFAWEPISTALASGIEDLLAFDWEEVTQGRDLPPIEVNWPEYLMLERMGRYRGVTARKAGKLIGYSGYDVFKPKRHKSLLWAFGDALYLDPAQRKGALAFKFLAEAHHLLKAAGVQYVTYGDMAVENLAAAKPRASFGDLLVKIGATPLDRTYVMKL